MVVHGGGGGGEGRGGGGDSRSGDIWGGMAVVGHSRYGDIGVGWW